MTGVDQLRCDDFLVALDTQLPGSREWTGDSQDVSSFFRLLHDK